MLQQGVPYFAYSENNRRERKRKLVEVAPRERNVRFKLYGTEGRRYIPTLQELAGLAIERAATTIQKFARAFSPRARYWYTQDYFWTSEYEEWEKKRGMQRLLLTARNFNQFKYLLSTDDDFISQRFALGRNRFRDSIRKGGPRGRYGFT